MSSSHRRTSVETKTIWGFFLAPSGLESILCTPKFGARTDRAGSLEKRPLIWRAGRKMNSAPFSRSSILIWFWIIYLSSFKIFRFLPEKFAFKFPPLIKNAAASNFHLHFLDSQSALSLNELNLSPVSWVSWFLVVLAQRRSTIAR